MRTCICCIRFTTVFFIYIPDVLRVFEVILLDEIFFYSASYNYAHYISVIYNLWQFFFYFDINPNLPSGHLLFTIYSYS